MDENEYVEMSEYEIKELYALWVKATKTEFFKRVPIDGLTEAVSEILLMFGVSRGSYDIWNEIDEDKMDGDFGDSVGNTRGAGRKSKVTPAIRAQILQLNQSGLSVRKIAKQVQVSSATVQRVISASRTKINSDTY